MSITREQAENIFRQIMATHPLPCRQTLFDTGDDYKNRTGKPPPAPAFFTAGAIYVILGNVRDMDSGIFLVAHEVGHRIFDPGEIVLCIGQNLCLQKEMTRRGLSPHHSMGGAQNIYSDIVVNILNWNDPGYQARFGDAIEKASLYLYGLDGSTRNHLLQNPLEGMKRGMINFFMGANWFRNHDPAAFQQIAAALSSDANAKDMWDRVEHLVARKTFALSDIQGYYVYTIPLMLSMNRLFKRGFSAGGVLPGRI